MPTLVATPVLVTAAGTPPKQIREYVGRVASQSEAASVARMTSPAGWSEPGQRPDFDEFTLVLRGRLHVEHEAGRLVVEAGQGVIARRGEWVRYSSPDPEGAEYVAVCVPAFALDLAHRDTET